MNIFTVYTQQKYISLKNLVIYKASAGSGKTHTLTGEYLKLAFISPDNFSRILAVTFTNKAAAEMKSRVIEELNLLINTPAQSAHYNALLDLFPNHNQKSIAVLAQQIRSNILHNYYRFSIGTIDSFVQKIVRAFSYEIGVKAGYAIEMDIQKVIDDLVEILFKKFSYDKALTNWLVTYANYKIDEGKSWDFREEMKTLSKEIFTEKFQSFLKQLLNDDKIRAKINSLTNKLRATAKTFETEMSDLGKKTLFVFENALSVPEKPGSKFKAIQNYLTNKIITPQKNDDFIPGKYVLQATEGIENWYAKKASKDIVNYIESLYPSLSEILNEVVTLFNDRFGEYLTAKNVLFNIHAFGILTDLASYLGEYREENNLLLISDTTLILKEILNVNEASFIYEKTGNRFNHILIDEFQDTSGFQWDNFRPLITNALAEGNRNLIVGDIKQSIYRWRGGNWRLLLDGVRNAIGANNIDEKNLTTNWRSKKNIIDFNNALFAISPDIIQNSFNAEIESINNDNIRTRLDELNYFEILNSAYSDSFQKLTNIEKNTGGEVNIHFVKVENRIHMKQQWRETANEKLPEMIEALLIDKAYRPQDITILVRTNREARDIFSLLAKYQHDNQDSLKYGLISAEALYIYNSPAVRLVINALKYLYDNKLQIYYAALLREFNALQNDTDFHDVFYASTQSHENNSFLPQLFVQNYQSLRKLPVFELIEELINIFKLNNLQGEYIYLRTLQDAAYQFSKDETPNLGDFIEWWDKNGLTLSVQLSDSQDAINIMTIHKSKGLGLETVIVPYCDWELESSSFFTSPILWAETQDEPFSLFPYLPVKYKKELAKTDFSFDYFEEKLYQHMDALNVLYVAFTRAKSHLLIFAPCDIKGKAITNMGDVLNLFAQSTLQKDNELIKPADFYNEEKSSFTLNTGSEPFKSKTQEKQIESFRLDSYPVNQWRNKINIYQHSADFFIKSIKYVEDRVNYGSLMHEIMAKIILPGDIDQALDEMYRLGKIDGNERDKLYKQTEKIISRPKVKEWFASDWQIITEKALLTPDGKTRIPDRVCIGKNKTLIIDFKFGEYNVEYKTQIKEYVELFEDMGHKNVEGIIYYAEDDNCELIKN